ncbi:MULTISPECIES: D-alanyl-D-alanine carboxypeptidase family protein [unclassified Streptomyces]|uniref:D-alanyl-D-alanine carboxypeptidase family protein n=1 Tax=unclassified Streptomyces TaxID=2593676 RepID=UPI0035E20C96
MAGESPDKSEQQKSSGTARSESDPRLAVFREPSAKDATAEGTDTATTVFRAGALAGADGDDEGEGTGGSDGANGADGSDGVKADTATAVFRTRPVEDVEDAEDDRSSEDGEGSEEPAATGAEADTEEPEGSEGPGSAAAADEAEKDAGKGAGGREGASGASGGVDAGVTGAAGGDGEADAAGSDADAVDGPAGDGSAEAGAAEKAAETVAEAAEEPETPREESGPKDGDEEAAAKGDPPESAASEVKAEAKADSDASEADADAPEADADADGDADDADTDAAKADTSESAAESADADADADAKTEKDGKGEKAAGAAAAAEPDAAADADAGSDKDAEEADKAAEDARSAKSAEPDKGDDGADGDDKDDKSGIDQPTAIFRAPAAARVDQPTTALKVISPDSKQTSGPASEPESSAERTSKFVPLRGDDVRPAPAAPRGSGAPVPAATPAAAPPASLSTAERTTQQPMPPKPPLDLLAELTNTPPPPETPVRTAVRRVKIWTPLVLLLLIVFAIVQMVRPLPDPELSLSVKSTYTFEGQSLELDWPSQGQSAVSVDGVGSMGSSGAQKPAPIASVAKAMTAYVVLKDHPLTGKEEGEKITVDQQAEDESKRDDESTAPIRKGQQFTQKQLLQLLMIPSGNNAARLFARWDSPSEKEFVAKMNAAAKELGMTNTTYTDPSGLDKATVSTAEDQIKLARAVMQNDVFREIVDTPQIRIPGIDQVIYNNNTILLQPGVSGIKTGSSTPAGGNLLWSANTVVDGKTLWIYGAVMGQQAGTGQPYDSLAMSLENSLKVIKGAQKAVTSAQVVKKGDVVGYVDDGLGGRAAVVATRNLKAKGWPGLKVELSISDNGKKIPHSASVGTEVGVVTVGTGPGKVSAPVALQEELKSPGFGQKLTRIG